MRKFGVPHREGSLFHCGYAVEAAEDRRNSGS